MANAHVIRDSLSKPIVCNVYVEDGTIRALESNPQPSEATDDLIDCSDHVVIPGLANLHLHSRPARALSDGLPVHVWHRRIDKLSRVMSPEDARVGALVAFGEMLRGGVTSAIVMTRYFQDAASAAVELGTRAIAVPLAGDTDAVAKGDLDDLHADLQAVRDHHQRSDRVSLWPGFDSPLTTTREGMRAVASTSAELGLGLHTHMAESRHEVDTFHERHGKFEGEVLDEEGLIKPGTVLAHCNWLEKEDFERFAERQVTVIHNPVSNMRFASGVCPIGELAEWKIRVALGTDGMLSGYQLNMFDAMRAAMMLQRISRHDSSALGVSEVFRMATENGSSVLKSNSGRIEVGAAADMAVINMSGLHLQPYRRDPLNDQDLLNLVVWCARPSDVQHVLCDGDVVVKDWRLTSTPEQVIRNRSNAVDERLRPLIER